MVMRYRSEEIAKLEVSQPGAQNWGGGRRQQCAAHRDDLGHVDHIHDCSEKGIKLSQNMQVGPCMLVGIQL